jgi:putative Ca2+/H+ antiporter (TMEM165/GDT1 family)
MPPAAAASAVACSSRPVLPGARRLVAGCVVVAPPRRTLAPALHARPSTPASPTPRQRPARRLSVRADAAVPSSSAAPAPQGGGGTSTLSAPAFVGASALAFGGALAWQAGWVGAFKVRAMGVRQQRTMRGVRVCESGCAGCCRRAAVCFFLFPTPVSLSPLSANLKKHAHLTLTTPRPPAQAALDASALGTSGALAAFSLVFLSELGDKTFFLAGLLAMRVGRSAALLGSVAALGAMTLISVAIGAAFQAVPTAVSSSVNVSHWASVACLVYFGLKTLKGALNTPPGPAMAESASANGGGDGAPAAAPELAAAQEELDEAERAGRVHDTVGRGASTQTATTPLAAWSRAATEVGSIIFLAEWGDRSMLATIALAAAQSPAGVAAGAVAGHAVATAIAVWGGVLVARHLSERTIGLIGGCLFLVFAGATLAGWM